MAKQKFHIWTSREHARMALEWQYGEIRSARAAEIVAGMPIRCGEVDFMPVATEVWNGTARTLKNAEKVANSLRQVIAFERGKRGGALLAGDVMARVEAVAS